MKGILICGGSGTRLRPLTEKTHKSLLSIGGKPMVFYPLQILLKAGIKEIMLITGPEHSGAFMQYLGSGAKFGCSFTYRIQDEPKGIAQALGMAEAFADAGPICALLGDNIFEEDLSKHIHSWSGQGGHLFFKEVTEPERFGVATVEETKNQKRKTSNSAPVLSLEEKPAKPKSNLAVTGCYLYNSRCFEIIRNLKPSARGELEITDVSKKYLAWGELTATVLRKEWVDAGTHEALKRAEELVRR
ncbi:MAG: sugar phosphate nucleotidyltransferase [Patescibacteria group bacterium]